MLSLNGIPVYNALVIDEATGMMKISLVDEPAVLSDFQAFADVRPMTYSILDDAKHLIRGCVMRCDFPIYRRDAYGEYYIVYKADTIRQMAQKYLAENRANLVNLMHMEDSDVEGVEMVQFFIKDTAAGIAPEGFDEISDGSLFAEFKVENEAIWEMVQNGTFRGFSLEGVFAVEPEEDETAKDIYDELEGLYKRHEKSTFSIMAKVKNLLKEIAQEVVTIEFASMSTDKGIVYYEGEELAEGTEVFGMTEEGEKFALEDGVYTSDAKVMEVADGKVTAIKDTEMVEEPEQVEESVEATEETPETVETEAAAEEPEQTEEPAAEEPAEEPAEEEKPEEPSEMEQRLASIEDRLAAIESFIAEATTMNAEFRREIDEIKANPLAQSAKEAYRAERKSVDDKLARACAIAKGINF